MRVLLVQDRQLLDGFRAGRSDALKVVYLHYQPRVTGFLRAGFSFTSGERHLRFRGYSSSFELETATQETLSRAFLPSARQAYDGLRPYADYVLAIARNYVLNELRKHERLVLVEDEQQLDEAGPPTAAAGGLGTEPTLEEREVERLLSGFLDKSSTVERTLFQQRFREEKAQEEVARALGLTRIQLRRIEHKLKKRLLDYLKHNGYLVGVGHEILGAGLRSWLL